MENNGTVLYLINAYKLPCNLVCNKWKEARRNSEDSPIQCSRLFIPDTHSV